MTNMEITKILKKRKEENISLGFYRYWILPNRVKRNLHNAHYVETGNTNSHNRIVNFFEGMTEKEYLRWLKFA